MMTSDEMFHSRKIKTAVLTGTVYVKLRSNALYRNGQMREVIPRGSAASDDLFPPDIVVADVRRHDQSYRITVWSEFYAPFEPGSRPSELDMTDSPDTHLLALVKDWIGTNGDPFIGYRR